MNTVKLLEILGETVSPFKLKTSVVFMKTVSENCIKPKKRVSIKKVDLFYKP